MFLFEEMSALSKNNIVFIVLGFMVFLMIYDTLLFNKSYNVNLEKTNGKMALNL